jgi:hypothetical protein
MDNFSTKDTLACKQTNKTVPTAAAPQDPRSAERVEVSLQTPRKHEKDEMTDAFCHY